MSHVKDSAEIKGLETRRNKLQAERKQLNIEIQDKQKESSEMKSRIDIIQKKIEKLKSKKPKDLIVSEHANASIYWKSYGDWFRGFKNENIAGR